MSEPIYFKFCYKFKSQSGIKCSGSGAVAIDPEEAKKRLSLPFDRSLEAIKKVHRTESLSHENCKITVQKLRHKPKFL